MKLRRGKNTESSTEPEASVQVQVHSGSRFTADPGQGVVRLFTSDSSSASWGTTSTVPCRMCRAGRDISAERLVHVAKSGLVARQYENGLFGASQYRCHIVPRLKREGPSPISLTMSVPAPTMGGPNDGAYGPCIRLLNVSRRFLPPSFGAVSFLMTITQRSSAVSGVLRSSCARNGSMTLYSGSGEKNSCGCVQTLKSVVRVA